MYRKLKLALITLLGFYFMTCSSNKSNPETELITEADTATSKAEIISSQATTEVISSMPSPIEMASMIKGSGAVFNGEILNSSSNLSKYTTYHSKALNLGVFGTDLGYINIYEKSQSALDYIKVVKNLADDLKVGQFFDFNTLSRLAKNTSKIDSVLYLSTSGFEKMDEYLKEKKRGNISVLILAGAWFEGLYISTQIAKTNPNKDLLDRIGEEKISFKDLITILTAYNTDENITNLIKELEPLKIEFEKVQITYQYSEPVAKEVDGALVIDDNSTSTVEMSEPLLKNITELAESIRYKIIN